MPDKYGFNILVDWGNLSVGCIETDCKAGGSIHEWNEERRKIHFLTHNFQMEGDSPTINGSKRLDKCRVCSKEFEQERKRGRPRVLCYICKPIGGE